MSNDTKRPHRTKTHGIDLTDELKYVDIEKQ